MMKAIYLKKMLDGWFSQFLANEKKKVVNNEEKPMKNMQRLRNFLNKHFDFRYNRLTGVTEYRGKEAVELPEWDGKDRVTPLLERVSDDSVWLKGGRYWLRAMTAQWWGMERSHANSLMPILVSGEQGLGKSTFCRQLLPDSLRNYYLDNLNFSPGTSPEKKLVIKGLINLDEFDKISEKRQPDLKNLLQMLSVPVYRGKRLGYVTKPRLASFIRIGGKVQAYESWELLPGAGALSGTVST